MKLGFLGLGKMGSRMVTKLVKEGHTVVVWNRTSEVAEQLLSEIKNQNADLKDIDQKFIIAKTVGEVVNQLDSPKVIWSMLPSGEPTEAILQEVSQFVQPGDIVIDGANNRYQATQKHYEDFSAKGIKFLGIGVSGGIIAAVEGYPMMVGGDKSAYEYVTPILDSLAKPNGGHEYFGVGGAGHFVKMVHNGIEYGMMQAIAEGFEVLEKSDYHFDLVKVANLWQKGTIVDSFLVDRAKDALVKDPDLSELEGVISATGEAAWTVEAAKQEGVETPIIEGSLTYRERSQTDEKVQQSFTAKMVAALRHEFGGHDVKKKE